MPRGTVPFFNGLLAHLAPLGRGGGGGRSRIGLPLPLAPPRSSCPSAHWPRCASSTRSPRGQSGGPKATRPTGRRVRPRSPTARSLRPRVKIFWTKRRFSRLHLRLLHPASRPQNRSPSDPVRSLRNRGGPDRRLPT